MNPSTLRSRAQRTIHPLEAHRRTIIPQHTRESEKKNVAARQILYNAMVICTTFFAFLLALLTFTVAFRSDETAPFSQMAMILPSLAYGIIAFVTYGVGGLLQHGRRFNWAFFQPWKGGTNFLALQFAAWTAISFSLVFPWLNEVGARLGWSFAYDSSASANDSRAFRELQSMLLVASSSFGLLGQILTLTSLFAYQRPQRDFELWTFLFQERPQATVVLYMFIAAQTVLAIYATFVLWIAEHMQSIFYSSLVTFIFVSVITSSIALTHGVGGPWLRGDHGYTAFQPGRGGWRFVAMQFCGWLLFSLVVLVVVARGVEAAAIPALLNAGFLQAYAASPESTPGRALLHVVARELLPYGSIGLGLLGLLAQVLLTLSLLIFEQDESVKATQYWRLARFNERKALLMIKTGLPPEAKRRIYDFL